MNWKKFYGWWVILLGLGLAGLGCGLSGDVVEEENIPRNALVVDVVANTGLQSWLSSAVATFNESKTETSDGERIYVRLQFTESGQAVADLAAEESLPTLWIPDDGVWANVLAEQGNGNYQTDCVSVAQSPLVIAIWRPLAESLGWPGRDLGWLDLASLAADSSAWSYYSGGQYGEMFRLGHTHPGLSATGVNSLLAVVQAAEGKVEAVSVEEIRQPIVQASVGAFEGAVAWFSTDTFSLGQTMVERGQAYLSAGIFYENLLISYGNEQLVPIYPLEGTFMATHPACLNRAGTAEQTEAATLFRNYLRDKDAQLLAVQYGLRPVSAGIPVETPAAAAAIGADWTQPSRIFGSPSVETIYAVQEVWQSARKTVNLVMLLDVSGSMSGGKIASARQAAVQFVEQMGEEDYLTVVTFSSNTTILVEHQQVGQIRSKVINLIQGLEAEGDTALYDAIGVGAEIIARTTSPNSTNALVLLSDGQDTASYLYNFDTFLVNAVTANNTTVFAIAYGDDADEEVLGGLAEQAVGNFYQGDEASIAGIYQEMSAAFGGSVGIGR